MMVRKILTLVLLSAGIPSFAQKDFARKIVDTLASPYMGGRGYVDDGNQRAAKYLNNEFKELGLQSFGKSYEQKFEYPVNTFPTPYSVSINGKLTEPGADYIIMPSTPSTKGTFEVVRFDKIPNSVFEMDNRFVIIDDSGITDKKKKEYLENMASSNAYKAKGVIMLCDKLTEETSETVGNFTFINALRSGPFKNSDSITIDIKNKFIESFHTQNLIGYIKGKVQPDSFIVFTAHYDHLGKMGDIYFPGANDNASGIAMLLSLAKYYSEHKDSLRYSIAFMAFSGEEIALLGSKYYTEHPLFPLSNIRFLINMDIMGTGDEGITVVNGTIYDAAFKDLLKINDQQHLLKLVKPRGETANSDHYFFYKNHVPSFFIYTMGGIKAYHDIYDRRETLPLTKFDEVFKLLIQFTTDLQSGKI